MTIKYLQDTLYHKLNMNKKLLKQKMSQVLRLKKDVDILEIEIHKELSRSFLKPVLEQCTFEYNSVGLHEVKKAPSELIEKIKNTLYLMDRWTWKVKLADDLELSYSNRLQLDFVYERPKTEYNDYGPYHKMNKKIADKYGIKFDFDDMVQSYDKLVENKNKEIQGYKDFFELFSVTL